MEKTNIAYEEWPEWVKTTTAFYWKRFILKNPKNIFGLSAVNLLVGVLLIVESYFLSDSLTDIKGKRADFILIFLAVINIVLGLYNLIVTYRMYTWVYTNSSWEERFAHKSNSKHQFQNILIWVVLLGITWGITCIFCC